MGSLVNTGVLLDNLDSILESITKLRDNLASVPRGDYLLEEVKETEMNQETNLERPLMATKEPVPRLGNRLAWGATLSHDAVASILWAANDLGLDPSYLTACMKFESNLNPRAKNPYSSATGLIQFMDGTARSLGTTVDALAKMDFVHQMNYVWKYFQQFKTRGYDLSKWTLSDVYMAILWPAGIGKSEDMPIFDEGMAEYAVNRGLDLNKDGRITKSEAAARPAKMLLEGLRSENVLEY